MSERAHFGDRLAGLVERHGPLCLGFDPYPDRIPALFGAAGPAAMRAFFLACIEAVAGWVAAIKPQIALFEAWGPEGLAALADITHAAREAGILVVLDAKRGDIGATGQGYVDAYLGPRAWLHADAVTVNPYMGLDTLSPWIEAASERGAGLFVLVRTSNPGANGFQGLDVEGAPLYVRVAEALAPLAEALEGASGWSSLGVVVGATAPDEAVRVRRILPSAPFLTPGYGAQGASAAEALAGWFSEPRRADAAGGGVLVNASRAALYPEAAANASDLLSWRMAFVDGFTRLRGDLADARPQV